MTKDDKVIDLTKDENKNVIDLSNDDKAPTPKPKLKKIKKNKSIHIKHGLSLKQQNLEPKASLTKVKTM